MNNFLFNRPEFRYPGLNWVLFAWRHRLGSNTYIPSLTCSHPQNTNKRPHVKGTRKISSQRGIRAKALEEKDSCFVFSLQLLIHSLLCLVLWRHFLGSLAGWFPTGFSQCTKRYQEMGYFFPDPFLPLWKLLHPSISALYQEAPPPWPQLLSELQPYFIPFAPLIPVVITVPTNSSLWLPQHPSMVLLTLP